MQADVEAIEAFFRRRYGREALFVPSGRFALYLAFREWLRPGDRLLLSPVTDDVVLFTVLAAGLVPVLGPLDPRTGNLDPASIDQGTWAGLQAVLTTNLYAIPDRMDLLEKACERHGVLLLEDAAHALDSRFDGRPIGTFGPVAAYSLHKHLGTAGGVLTFAEADRRELLARRAQKELRPRSLGPTVAELARVVRAKAGAPDRGPAWLRSIGDRVFPRSNRGAAHRMPYAVADVKRAQDEDRGLDSFDRWVRMDNPAYRARPLRASLRMAVRRLNEFEENRRLRLAGARKLLDLGLTPSTVPVPRDVALLRVPLFVRDREAVIAHLARRGLTTEYVYDPPLDRYAPAFTEALPSPQDAGRWSADVLPVNPLSADRFLAILRESPGLVRPVAGPT